MTMSDTSKPSAASATGSTAEPQFTRARRALAWRYSALAILALAVISLATYGLFSQRFGVDFDEDSDEHLREGAAHERIETAARESALGELAESILLIDALAAVLLVAASHALAARAIAPLEEAFRRERRFLADVAHELRTPLSVVRATAEVAATGTDVDRQKFTRSAIEEVDQMAATVGDLLFLEERRSGARPSAAERVDLPALGRRQVERARAYAAARGVSIVGPAEVATTVAVSGRENDLGRAVGNLVKNALDFTPAGGRVEVRVRREKNRAIIEVADTGVGVPSEDLPRIFERFYKADESRARRASAGSGLGLAIVAEIAGAHGGEASAASELGKGTTVTLNLPTA